MNSSSAVQSELDSRDEVQTSSAEDLSLAPLRHSRTENTASLVEPDFRAFRSAHAVAARLAGRLNATKVSDAEHNSLLEERQHLLDKKLAGTISRSEANRLEYVRWSLDRIEDAKHGATIDRLESSVEVYERFLAEMRNLEYQLNQKLKSNRN